MSEGPGRGLALIDELGAAGELDRYHLFHAARADMLRRLGSFEAAADAYRRALALMANGVERAYLGAPPRRALSVQLCLAEHGRIAAGEAGAAAGSNTAR